MEFRFFFLLTNDVQGHPHSNKRFNLFQYQLYWCVRLLYTRPVYIGSWCTTNWELGSPQQGTIAWLPIHTHASIKNLHGDFWLIQVLVTWGTDGIAAVSKVPCTLIEDSWWWVKNGLMSQLVEADEGFDHLGDVGLLQCSISVLSPGFGNQKRHPQLAR